MRTGTLFLSRKICAILQAQPLVLPLSLIDTYMCVAFLHSGGLKFENPDIFGL